MSDSKEDLKKVIELSKASAAEKTALLYKVDKEGVTDDLVLEIRELLNKMEDDLAAQVPEIAELTQAEKQFNSEMTAIEKDTNKLNKQLSDELDKLDIQATRKALEK